MFLKLLKNFRFVALCVAVLFQANSLKAQNATLVEESLNDIKAVGFMGLGGAVLGLSTLSFVDKPEDHLKNILIGGSVGIIIGVGYVAWSQANKSQNIYKQNALFEADQDFSTRGRMAFHSKIREERWASFTKNVESFNYSFSF